MSRPLGGVYQVAWVVPDLHRAMEGWTRRREAGPFYLFEHYEIQDLPRHGRPLRLDMSIALAFSGQTCIELMEIHDSDFSAFASVATPALHHVARLVGDFDRWIETGEAEVAAIGRLTPTARTGFLDTTGRIGCMTELVEYTTEVEGMLAAMEDSARGWTGADPVRRFA